MLSVAQRTRSGVLLGVLVLLTTACDDDPFETAWNENRTEVTVYALNHPDDVTQTAWDLLPGAGRRLEDPDTGNDWDLAMREEDGTFYFLPPRNLGVPSRVGIHRVPNVEWEDVREAPADTAAYETREPVEVAEDDIYVVRTREQSDRFGRVCVFYAKLEPVDLDSDLLRLRFTYDINPRCSDRNLVPDDVDW